MKRRTVQSKARRARGHALSPYKRKHKKPYSYPFPTGAGSWELRRKAEAKKAEKHNEV